MKKGFKRGVSGFGNIRSTICATPLPKLGKSFISLFTTIPCTNKSLPLDGMARNDFPSRWIRNWWCLDPFYSYHLIPEEKKNIWPELESNPGPLTSHSQATTLITRPWLLGQLGQSYYATKSILTKTDSSEIFFNFLTEFSPCSNFFLTGAEIRWVLRFFQIWRHFFKFSRHFFVDIVAQFPTESCRPLGPSIIKS